MTCILGVHQTHTASSDFFLHRTRWWSRRDESEQLISNCRCGSSQIDRRKPDAMFLDDRGFVDAFPNGRMSARSVRCRLIEIWLIQLHISARKRYPPHSVRQPWSQRHMIEDQSCRPVSADETKAGFLKLAEEGDEMAAVYEGQARLYEEAGITGIHPSADTLRARAQSARREAGQSRESAATLA